MEHPYLLFLGNAKDQLAAKTAQGVADWRPEWCVGQLRLEGCKADLGLPDLSLKEAAEKGAKTLLIGVVNPGGVMNQDWTTVLVDALDAGLDIGSGLHSPLSDTKELADAAARNGRKLIDVRIPSQQLDTGTGVKRSGKRLLTVGTDCSLGKKYTALALEKEMRAQGLDADFCATGQTGVMIAGRGLAIDAVVADFISGAAEWISPEAAPDHWDVIEGQGSLFHPAFAGVSLGLLHGAQPDALVLCHEPTRTNMRNLPGHPIPDIQECMDLNLIAARLTNKDVKFVGISINSSELDDDARKKYLAETEAKYGLPCADPLIEGMGRIVENLS
jgi:uncharacterized NAD-dependent epimerase/dehydratase family protein